MCFIEEVAFESAFEMDVSISGCSLQDFQLVYRVRGLGSLCINN